jgi:hypothetical protein
MSVHRHARRLVDQLDSDVRTAARVDPFAAAEDRFGLLVEPAASFAGRGAGGWCDGASITTDGIVLYRPTFGRRQNFTLAHELGHHLVVADEDCASWLADQPGGDRLEEEVCDLVAARLLIPDELLDDALAGRPVSADTVRRLYAGSQASRTACAVAVAAKIPCDGFVALVEHGTHEVFAAARTRDTRPYAWRGDTIPDAHPLRRPDPPAKAKSWWARTGNDRRTYYLSTTDIDGMTCAVFAENDLWQVETMHFPDVVEADRGNDATIRCPCGYEGRTRMWPCGRCGVPECPRCHECDCPRRERREQRGRCASCMTSVRSHLLVEGLCDNCR